MIPVTTTATQLAWHSIAGGDLAPTADGECRICGGKLVGNVSRHEISPSWMDEFKTKARYSDHVCEACEWTRKNRNITMKLSMGLIISPEIGALYYNREQVDDYLEMAANLKGPYIIIFNKANGPYKRHLLFETAVSWGQPPYITILTERDNYTVPLKIGRIRYALDYLTEKYGGKRLEKRDAYDLIRNNDILWAVAFSLYARKYYKKKPKEVI